MTMDPELFLPQEEVTPLVLALEKFASEVNDPEERRNVLKNAGVARSLIEDLKFETKPKAFAQTLIAKFKDYCVSNARLDYHPVVSLLQYLLEVYQNELGKHTELCARLVKRGQENFKALIARSSIGRIESLQGEGIGTGVLVGPQLLLTCAHVFKTVRKASVRFGYKSGCNGEEEGEAFELDLNSVRSDSHLDYALVAIKGQPKQPPAVLDQGELNGGQEIRLIHHPLGGYIVISDVGQITQVRASYIGHDINADPGSSGSPLYNEHWQVVAIHQGGPNKNHPDMPDTTKGEGVPINAFWDKISFHQSFQGKRAGKIEHALDLARQEQSSSRLQEQVKIPQIKIDVGIIYDYNLVDEMREFWGRLNPPEGAFAFSIGGDVTLLRRYIVERLLRELKKIIGERNYKPTEINLYPKYIKEGRLGDGTISGLKIIEHMLKTEKKGRRISDLFKNNSTFDIVLVIFCIDMPSEDMSVVTKTFWEEARTRISHYLKNQGRRFVVIWADGNVERRAAPIEYPVDEFTILTLPGAFNMDHLLGSFKGQLSSILDNQEEVTDKIIKDKIIKDCLGRLDKHDGRLLQTYEEMERIVQELNEGYVIYV